LKALGLNFCVAGPDRNPLKVKRPSAFVFVVNVTLPTAQPLTVYLDWRAAPWFAWVMGDSYRAPKSCCQQGNYDL